jgi:hypothetical protein
MSVDELCRHARETAPLPVQPEREQAPKHDVPLLRSQLEPDIRDAVRQDEVAVEERDGRIGKDGHDEVLRARTPRERNGECQQKGRREEEHRGVREHSRYECRTHPEQHGRPGTVLCEPEPECEDAYREAEACGHLRASLACSRDHPLVARQCVEKDEQAQGCAATKQKRRPRRRQQCKVERHWRAGSTLGRLRKSESEPHGP